MVLVYQSTFLFHFTMLAPTYSNVSTKRKVSSFLTLKFYYEQPSFHIGMGSLPLTRKFHEEHNDTYFDLPRTFLLDEFAFKSHSSTQKWPLRKLWVKFICGEELVAMPHLKSCGPRVEVYIQWASFVLQTNGSVMQIWTSWIIFMNETFQVKRQWSRASIASLL